MATQPDSNSATSNQKHPLWRQTWFQIVVILTLGAALRLLVVFNQGFEADISFWKSWGLAPYDGGLVWSLHNTNNNYPTPFAYILWFLTIVYSLFKDPHNFYEFWNNNNLLFLFLAKLPSILADFGIFGFFIFVGKNAKKLGFPQFPLNLYLLFGALYLINPLPILDGAWWGQVDSLGVCVFIMAFLAAVSGRPFLAGFVYMTALMIKLQNMIYGPIFFIFLWQLYGYRGLIQGITGTVLAFFGLNIEFLLARDMSRVINSLTDNYDYFPLLSLNSYNLWWIVAGGAGMKTSDKINVLGMLNGKQVGLILFSGMYLFGTLLMLLAKRMPVGLNEHEQRKSIIYRFSTALVVGVAAFFLFQTQSHERYAFPISAFLLIWGTFFLFFKHTDQISTIFKTNTFKFFIGFYIAFSLIYFYNLHTALVANYPNNGLPFLKEFTQTIYTIPAAAIQIILLGIFLFAVAKTIHSWAYLLSLLFITSMLIKGNLPLILGKPVSLTAFTPVVSEQGYGKRIYDMPVNASVGGFSKWSPLSVQYSFYKKGIGTHAFSFMDYYIGGNFKRFTTDMGIDTQAGSAGSGIFEIYGDGQLLYRSEKIGRYEYPRHADVDITGVKKLGLVTTDAGDGKNDDHTDWLRPILWQ